MKHIIKINLLSLLLILLVHSLHSVKAARVFISSELPPAAAAHDLSGISKVNAIPRKVGHLGNTADHNNPWQLMGMEECKSGDEECEKRRLLSEAHLDYIYTQVHHKP